MTKYLVDKELLETAAFVLGIECFDAEHDAIRAILAQPAHDVASVPDAYRMARALSDRYADQRGVDQDDYWKLYGHVYIVDVRAMLEGAKHE